MLSTPGPKYSTIAPVPPLTVKMPASLQMTSLGAVQLDILPVSFTPMSCALMPSVSDVAHARLGQLSVELAINECERAQ